MENIVTDEKSENRHSLLSFLSRRINQTSSNSLFGNQYFNQIFHDVYFFNAKNPKSEYKTASDTFNKQLQKDVALDIQLFLDDELSNITVVPLYISRKAKSDKNNNNKNKNKNKTNKNKNKQNGHSSVSGNKRKRLNPLSNYNKNESGHCTTYNSPPTKRLRTTPLPCNADNISDLIPNLQFPPLLPPINVTKQQSLLNNLRAKASRFEQWSQTDIQSVHVYAMQFNKLPWITKREEKRLWCFVYKQDLSAPFPWKLKKPQKPTTAKRAPSLSKYFGIIDHQKEKNGYFISQQYETYFSAIYKDIPQQSKKNIEDAIQMMLNEETTNPYDLNMRKKSIIIPICRHNDVRCQKVMVELKKLNVPNIHKLKCCDITSNLSNILNRRNNSNSLEIDSESDEDMDNEDDDDIDMET